MGSQVPLCDIQSICGFFTGPWTVTRLLFTARCSVHLLPKVRQTAVWTPPFLFLRRRWVVMVKTRRFHTAFTFAQPPDRCCGPPLNPICSLPGLLANRFEADIVVIVLAEKVWSVGANIAVKALEVLRDAQRSVWGCDCL